MSGEQLAAAYRQSLAARPDWLRAVQDRAFGRLEADGLPGPRDENWKYTDLGPFAARAGAYLAGDADAAGDASGAAAPEPLAPTEALRLEFLNGRLVGNPAPGAAAGLEITALNAADAAARETLRAALERPGADSAGSLAWLNAAFLSDGVLVRVAPGAHIGTPLHLWFRADGQPVMAQPRILLQLGDGARLTCIAEHAGTGETAANVVVLAEAAGGAELEYLRIQRESAAAHHLGTQRVRLGRDARLHAVLVDLGGAMARNDLQVELAAPGAAADVAALLLAPGGALADQHARVDHLAPATRSRQRVRGIASGRAVFNGSIIVHPGADGTDAQLSNRNLLLAAGAEVDTKPELEIYADDVKCSHGATTGRLDAQALFYLRSRGIPAAEARQLLVHAFAAEITGEIGLPALRAGVEALLARSLGTPLPATGAGS